MQVVVGLRAEPIRGDYVVEVRTAIPLLRFASCYESGSRAIKVAERTFGSAADFAGEMVTGVTVKAPDGRVIWGRKRKVEDVRRWRMLEGREKLPPPPRRKR